MFTTYFDELMGTSEFRDLKPIFELDPVLSSHAHRRPHIANLHFEFWKIPYGKRSKVKNFGGCPRVGAYVLKFINIGGLVRTKFRAKRGNFSRKYCPFHKQKLFCLAT